MNKIKICMYGAASDSIEKEYIRQTEQLGREIAANGYTLVYGGGSSGLMGACTRGMAAGNGIVIGVIPEFMKEFQNINERCTQLITTESLADRKEVMEKLADAFVILPGGVGTMDEFFQILTLSYLSQKSVPIVLFNIKGYFDPILAFIDAGIEKGFIHERLRNLFAVKTTPEGVLSAINHAL